MQYFLDSGLDDYRELMEVYGGSDIFMLAIEFLNIAFPEWKTNNGLGLGAPEFLLLIVRKNYNNCGNNCSEDVISQLYRDLESSYIKSRDYNYKNFTEMCNEMFIQMDDFELSQCLNELDRTLTILPQELVLDQLIEMLGKKICFDFKLKGF